MEYRLSYSFLVGMQNGTVTLEVSWSVSYKTIHNHTMWSSNHIPWYLLKWTETSGHTKLMFCTWMFIVALFITAKTWEQPRCPSLDERISQLWVHLCNEILFGAKIKWAIKPWKDMEKTSRHITKWKIPTWKILHTY